MNLTFTQRLHVSVWNMSNCLFQYLEYAQVTWTLLKTNFMLTIVAN